MNFVGKGDFDWEKHSKICCLVLFICPFCILLLLLKLNQVIRLYSDYRLGNDAMRHTSELSVFSCFYFMEKRSTLN